MKQKMNAKARTEILSVLYWSTCSQAPLGMLKISSLFLRPCWRVLTSLPLTVPYYLPANIFHHLFKIYFHVSSIKITKQWGPNDVTPAAIASRDPNISVLSSTFPIPLLANIGIYEIRNLLLLWLSSCISGHSQLFDVTSCFTQLCATTIGGVQGSVLGFLPLPLYNNGIFKVIRQGASFIFANDNKTAYHFGAGLFNSTLALVYKNIKSLINRCSKWFIEVSADGHFLTTCTCHASLAPFSSLHHTKLRI